MTGRRSSPFLESDGIIPTCAREASLVPAASAPSSTRPDSPCLVGRGGWPKGAEHAIYKSAPEYLLRTSTTCVPDRPRNVIVPAIHSFTYSFPPTPRASTAAPEETAAMDYHSSIADEEHPAGVSPWGSSPPASPPRRNESNFSSLGNDPAYNYTPSSEPNNGLDRGDLAGNAFAHPEQTGFEQSQPHEPSQQSPFGGPLDQPAPQEQAVPQQQGEAHDQPPAVGAPATAQEQQVQRPVAPQYKLQAKITGLERTGRKDPILRFDVHVSQICHLSARLHADCPP
jgi:hypothetical protein